MILLAARLIGAAAAGALLAVSFPPVGWWWAAPSAIALLVVVLSPLRGHPPRARTGALAGFLAGVAFFLLLVPWVGLYVGSYAAWGLAVVEALYLAAFGAGAVVILRAGLTPGVHGGRRCAAALLGVAGWWSLWEWVRSSWPWGGFPWGRLAFGQADGPLLPLAALGGTALLGFAVAALGTALGFAVVMLLRRERPVRQLTGLLAVPLVTGGLVAAASVPRDDQPTRTLDVAVIQGNVPRLGLDFNAQKRAVLENHLRVTAELADRVDAHEAPRPDLVLWPENASDISPLADRRAGDQISALSRRLQAPILVGTVLGTGQGREATNSYLVWDGRAADRDEDPVRDRHDKKFIQPFGEWLPMRAPLEAIFPIARTAGHFVPGDGDGVVTAAGVDVGVAICFEVAFDAAARDPVAQGAQFLAVPTNNATFGRSPMTYQQLAMSRVRAVEHHVPVLIAATSGVSAVIDPDGTVQQETGIFEPAGLVAQIEVGAAGTMATRLGDTPQAVSCLIGLVGVAWALVRTRRRPVTDNEEFQVTEPTTPGGGVPSSRTLVIIPTYDERDNLPGVVDRLLTAAPDVSVLVADDNSPDGTGEIADRLAAEDPRGRISVLHRKGKEGLGAAYIAGFRWGLERGYTVLVEMDADGSHPPERLPAMLAAVDNGADLAIGSRYVPGGAVLNWPWQRHVISRGGNIYSRLLLGVRIKDITAGYRAYRADALAELDLDTIESKGYCFQIDMTWRLLNNDRTVVEVPITFTERTVGQSKMSESIFREAAVNVARWGWEKRRRQLRSLVGR